MVSGSNFFQGVFGIIIFFVAVFISSPVAALYGLTASILGAGLSQLNGEPIQEVPHGFIWF